jgi:two-component system nitrogen regulation sensor histidine kinase GlnL
MTSSASSLPSSQDATKLDTTPQAAPANEGSVAHAAMQAYAMLESLPEALLLLNASGEIEAANATAEQLFMQSRRKMMGQAITSWLTESEALSMALRQCWLTQTPQKERRYTLQPRHQEALPVQMECWPVMDAQGAECSAVLMRLRPICSTQTAATLVQDSAAYMAAVLAHEIKNPLSGIRGAAQLIAPHLPPSTETMGKLILREVDRIRTLVEQMEIFNQPQAMALEPVNIHEILRHAVLLMRAGASTEIEFSEQFDPSLPEANAHKDALTQVILNLMKNGIEAMHAVPNPKLTLKTDYYRDGAGHSFLRLRVIDHGCGVPEKIQTTVFEPFVTTKNQSCYEYGRGLGLPVCAKLTQDMGGRLQLAESKPGYTCFELLLAIHR